MEIPDDRRDFQYKNTGWSRIRSTPNDLVRGTRENIHQRRQPIIIQAIPTDFFHGLPHGLSYCISQSSPVQSGNNQNGALVINSQSFSKLYRPWPTSLYVSLENRRREHSICWRQKTKEGVRQLCVVQMRTHNINTTSASQKSTYDVISRLELSLYHRFQ